MMQMTRWTPPVTLDAKAQTWLDPIALQSFWNITTSCMMMSRRPMSWSCKFLIEIAMKNGSQESWISCTYFLKPCLAPSTPWSKTFRSKWCKRRRAVSHSSKHLCLPSKWWDWSETTHKQKNRWISSWWVIHFSIGTMSGPGSTGPCTPAIAGRPCSNLSQKLASIDKKYKARW